MLRAIVVESKCRAATFHLNDKRRRRVGNRPRLEHNLRRTVKSTSSLRARLRQTLPRAPSNLQSAGRRTFAVREYGELERRKRIGDAGGRDVNAVTARSLVANAATSIGIVSCVG